MKFLRLKIANYRGVSSAEVRFSPLGITLVQGPNEAGKTSLGEAIGLLFEYPDNSNTARSTPSAPSTATKGPKSSSRPRAGPTASTISSGSTKSPRHGWPSHGPGPKTSPGARRTTAPPPSSKKPSTSPCGRR